MARTFLGAWLDARRNSGRLVMRIEDLDRPRIVRGATDMLLRDLEWLGLTWDEGPARPGGSAPYWQSEREANYQAGLAALSALGRTFRCTCSRREVALAASAPHGPGDEGPRYPGICRSGPSHPDRPAAIRLRTEPTDRISHTDTLFGSIAQNVHEIVGDFVIRRADGLWSYQLAVTIDDLGQGITRIVRGQDLLHSTPRQLLLRRLLAPRAPPIETLHLPLLRASDGRRLAKRDGDVGVAACRASGQPPEQVIGRLAATFGLVPEGTVCAASDLIPLWNPTRLPREDQVLARPRNPS